MPVCPVLFWKSGMERTGKPITRHRISIAVFKFPKIPGLFKSWKKKFSKLYGKSVKITDIPLERIILSPYELGSIIGVPNCYTPETNTPYPLCIGNGSAMCERCSLYACLDYNKYK